MYLRELGTSLWRRRYLVALALLLAASCVWWIGSQLQPTYRATASVVLVPPETTLGETGNPFLFLGGLEQSVDVLSRAVNSDDAEGRIKARAPHGDFEVLADATTSAPILLTTTEAGSAAEALELLDAVLAEIPVSLEALQKDIAVPESARIGSQLVSITEVPEVDQKARYRTMVMAGIAALGGLLVVIALLDGILERRRLGTPPREGGSSDSEADTRKS